MATKGNEKQDGHVRQISFMESRDHVVLCPRRMEAAPCHKQGNYTTAEDEPDTVVVLAVHKLLRNIFWSICLHAAA